MVDAITLRIDTELASRLSQYLIVNPGLSAAAVATRALNAYLPKLPKPARGARISGSGQDEISGRAGFEFGVSAGRCLAEKLGQLISPVATELILQDGRRATLRTAKGSNTQWGCLNTVLKRVDVVLCAFTSDGHTFDIWEVDAKVWAREARNASPGHKLHNKLTLMGKSAVKNFGKNFGSLEV